MFKKLRKKLEEGAEQVAKQVNLKPDQEEPAPKAAEGKLIDLDIGASSSPSTPTRPPPPRSTSTPANVSCYGTVPSQLNLQQQ